MTSVLRNRDIRTESDERERQMLIATVSRHATEYPNATAKGSHQKPQVATRNHRPRYWMYRLLPEARNGLHQSRGIPMQGLILVVWPPDP